MPSRSLVSPSHPMHDACYRLVYVHLMCYPSYNPSANLLFVCKKRKLQIMSERKQQSWHVPLRVRFRSPVEQAQWEREHEALPPRDSQPLPSPTSEISADIEVLQHTRK